MTDIETVKMYRQKYGIKSSDNWLYAERRKEY